MHDLNYDVSQIQESYDRTLEAKNSLEEEKKEMTDKLEALAHYESQIAEIIQWYAAAAAAASLCLTLQCFYFQVSK